MEWQVKAIRGATTASENTEEAIASAVTELLKELHERNCIDPDRIVSVIFTATKDLDAVFPAAIARRAYPEWRDVALMDVQQMHVKNSLPLCIRFLIHANLPADVVIHHPYLGKAWNLRPDFGNSNLGRETKVEWGVKAIRGATTASENTEEAIDSAVTELLKELHKRNCIDPERIVSVMFTVTQDLDAVYPAAKARLAYPEWQHVALMDMQQMHIEDSLPRCIRFLIHANLPADVVIYHPYLRGASNLRPDRSLVS